MKYGIWRHENSIGNSAEHTIGLYKHLLRNPDPEAEIYVENEFQKWFALCIPCVKTENVKFFPFNISKMKDKEIYEHPFFLDVKMPSCYPFSSTYPGTWADLAKYPDCTLEFPEHIYTPSEELPKDAVIIHFREKGTFQKRFVGSHEENERFVTLESMLPVIKTLADRGHKVVRVGDKGMTPLPDHENIYDFALNGTGRIEDELYMIANSKLFISTDSGIWPIVAGMKKNLLFTNITSPFNNMVQKIPFEERKFHPNPDRVTFVQDGEKFIEASIPTKLMKLDIVKWIPTETSECLFKRFVWSEDLKAGFTLSCPSLQILYYALRSIGDPHYKDLGPKPQ